VDLFWPGLALTLGVLSRAGRGLAFDWDRLQMGWIVSGLACSGHTLTRACSGLGLVWAWVSCSGQCLGEPWPGITSTWDGLGRVRLVWVRSGLGLFWAQSGPGWHGVGWPGPRPAHAKLQASRMPVSGQTRTKHIKEAALASTGQVRPRRGKVQVSACRGQPGPCKANPGLGQPMLAKAQASTSPVAGQNRSRTSQA
jgi:hypothetical protein